MAMDIAWGGEKMDLSQEVGFLAALYHAARLRVGGALLAAPVCSSFVFMRHGPSSMF